MPRFPSPPRPHPQGFTLIEVLVALMIMAFLAVMAWQGVDGISRARDYSQTRLDQTLRLNTVLAQWEQDLASIQRSPTAAVEPLQFDGNSLRLLRRSELGLQLVVWSMRPSDRQGQLELMRWTSLPMVGSKDLEDASKRAQQFVGTEPGQLRTVTGISQWQVYFYRNNSWSNSQSTGDVSSVSPGEGVAPTGGAANALPQGVRLVLTFGEGAGMQGSLTRDIQLGPDWDAR